MPLTCPSCKIFSKGTRFNHADALLAAIRPGHPDSKWIQEHGQSVNLSFHGVCKVIHNRREICSLICLSAEHECLCLVYSKLQCVHLIQSTTDSRFRTKTASQKLDGKEKQNFSIIHVSAASIWKLQKHLLLTSCTVYLKLNSFGNRIKPQVIPQANRQGMAQVSPTSSSDLVPYRNNHTRPMKIGLPSHFPEKWSRMVLKAAEKSHRTKRNIHNCLHFNAVCLPMHDPVQSSSITVSCTPMFKIQGYL